MGVVNIEYNIELAKESLDPVATGAKIKFDPKMQIQILYFICF